MTRLLSRFLMHSTRTSTPASAPTGTTAGGPARRLAVAAALLGGLATTASAQVPLESAMGLKPRQPDVPHDTLTAEQMKQSAIRQQRFNEGTGYIVTGPDGQTLRELVDTTKDDRLNEFRYFQLGLETYREVDTNGDGRPDDYRWFNTAGTRWGVDTNRDFKIDRWKRISAEEATREAVLAMAAGDAARLQAVMFNEQDAKTLGLSPELASQMLERSSNVEGQLKQALAGGRINKSTRWERFDSAMLMPILVPAESGRADRDLIAYENVMSIARTGQDDVFLNVGEVIQVGDVFKLTRVPQPLDPTQQVATEAGLLVQPPAGALAAAGGDFPPQVRKLLEELEALSKQRPPADAELKEMQAFNVRRSDVLGRLVEAAPNEEFRRQFQQERVDSIAAAAMFGAYPEPLESLRELEGTVPDEFKPYTMYRRIQVEYQERARDDEENGKASTAWYLKALESFIRKYPKSNDAADAIWQLASTLELQGDIKKARDWYAAGAKGFGQTTPGEKAAGAVNRIGLEGQPLKLSGTTVDGKSIDLSSLRGQPTAVVFWTTWAEPFVDQLPDLLALQKQYESNGFRVLGVNLDGAGAPVEQFIKEQGIRFPVIDGNAGSSASGTDSDIARRFGIIQLPTILLVGRDGRVVDNSATVDSLENDVPKLLLRK